MELSRSVVVVLINRYSFANWFNCTTFMWIQLLLMMEMLTSSSADLGWTALGTETSWNIQYGATGSHHGPGTAAGLMLLQILTCCFNCSDFLRLLDTWQIVVEINQLWYVHLRHL